MNRSFNHWIQYTDGCSGQFKSGYCIADLFEVSDQLNIPNAKFSYFESHEGKSTSDTIGSIVKGAFTRGVLKSDFGIVNIDDILALIHSEIKPSTKKFKFFLVEKFGMFDKKTSKSRRYCKLSGISKMHCFKIYNNVMIAQQYTYTECSNNKFCDSCSLLKTVDPSSITNPEKVKFITVAKQEKTSKVRQIVKVSLERYVMRKTLAIQMNQIPMIQTQIMRMQASVHMKLYGESTEDFGIPLRL